MEKAPDGLPVPLFDALLAWSDLALVEEVKSEERRHTPYEMARFSKPSLLPHKEHLDPKKRGWADDRDYTMLYAAWDGLERDFKRRILSGEIHILGVQTAPECETTHRVVPSVWAADFRFDFQNDFIIVRKNRYTAVRATRIRPVEAKSWQGPAPEEPITAESVRRLTDAEVFTLLEDYARRVIEEPYALMLPSRISFMPMIARKMRHRAGVGELQGKLAHEARDLATWIAERVPSHQSPDVHSIENAMRDEYRVLKAQSNAMKP